MGRGVWRKGAVNLHARVAACDDEYLALEVAKAVGVESHDVGQCLDGAAKPLGSRCPSAILIRLFEV